LTLNGNQYKEYTITEDVPKLVIDLTADLAPAREGKEIVSAQFIRREYGKSIETYYKDCINVLSNIFI
jgi:hypothetical protein